jgi:hypothetical protein
MAGVADETVIDFARSERRLLLIEEKDFWKLVFAAAKQNSGVILIRYPASARAALSAAVLKLLSDSGESLYSRFAVHVCAKRVPRRAGRTPDYSSLIE